MLIDRWKNYNEKKYERRNGGNTLSTHCCIKIRKYFFSVITEGVSRVAIVGFLSFMNIYQYSFVKLGNSYSIGFRELTFRVTF